MTPEGQEYVAELIRQHKIRGDSAEVIVETALRVFCRDVMESIPYKSKGSSDIAFAFVGFRNKLFGLPMK